MSGASIKANFNNARNAQQGDVISKAKRATKGQDPNKLLETARDLEAVFLGMVFSEMSKTVDTQGGIMPPSPGREMFEGWFRTEIAKQWAHGEGTGLAETIASSIQGPSKTAALSKYRGGTKLGVPPVEGRITSSFGHRHHPVTHKHSFHSGVDIAVPVGTSVRSPFAGKVTEVSQDSLLGLKVVVEHKGGMRSVFGHNSSADVKVGQTVRAGEVLGASGNTGRTTGPHLHYTLYKNGKAVDPERYVRFPKK